MITKVCYNWFYCTDKDYGDEFCVFEVGERDVLSIHEHLPRGDGDVHYCRVTFADGHQIRVLNINAVTTDKYGF